MDRSTWTTCSSCSPTTALRAQQSSRAKRDNTCCTSHLAKGLLASRRGNIASGEDSSIGRRLWNTEGANNLATIIDAIGTGTNRFWYVERYESLCIPQEPMEDAISDPTGILKGPDNLAPIVNAVRCSADSARDIQRYEGPSVPQK